ncbi:MAG: hypothetical protein ACOX6D_05605 [Thermoguttaceae bacterium]|jgi:hypothetical protein
MNRTARLAVFCLLVLLLSGKNFLDAQTAGGIFPPGSDFYGNQVISPSPYPMSFPMQGDIFQGVPIQGNVLQGAAIPMPGGGDLGSLSGTVIPYDSPLLSQYGFETGQPYGPNNPPPVVDTTRRNLRDNGIIKAQEVPAPDVLLKALNLQLEAWAPDQVLLDDLTPATVMKMTVPYGIDTRFLCRPIGGQTVTPRSGRVTPKSEPAYAVGILCWNLPIGNRRIFNPSGDLLVPRTGFGYQQVRGELLASMAMANVSAGYEIRANSDRTMTVRDLMESEMSQMTLQEDLSMLAVGLAFYLDDIGRTWQEASGRTMSLVSLAEYELNRPVYWSRSESVNRLLGLTYLSERFHQEIEKGNGEPHLREVTENIDSNLKTVHRRALEGLNDAGLRQTRFLSGKEIRSAVDVLLVNGHFLRWHLVASDRFPVNSQSLRKSIYHLALTLAQFYNPKKDPLRTFSGKEVEAISVTLHALRLYVKKYTKDPDSESQVPEPQDFALQGIESDAE